MITRRWDRRPKRCEALGEPKTLRRSLPAAGHAACAWTEQSGLAEGEKWRLKRPLRAAVQDAIRTHARGVYFSLAPTLGYYKCNVYNLIFIVKLASTPPLGGWGGESKTMLRYEY